MRILIAALVAAVLVPQEGTTFSKEIPKKGAKYAETQTFDFEMTIAISQEGNVIQKMETEQTKREERTVEVLESGEQVTKVAVRYGKVEEKQKQSMTGTQETKSPVSGKSYIVERKGEDLVVAGGEGKEAPDDEAQVVRNDYRNLGKGDEFARIFEGKSLKVGEKSAVSKDLAMDLFGGGEKDPNLKVDEFTFTLREFREAQGFRCGVFDVVVKMSGEAGPGMKMSMEMKGEALLGVKNLWPVSLEMTGTMKMGGGVPDANMEMKGEGKMKIRIARTYGS